MAVDCLVIGGGVIGLTTAWRLAQQGLRVRVVDQGAPGREASWAGAGILPPGLAGQPHDPLVKLTHRANQLWPVQSTELLESTGIDNEFHCCGGIEFAVRSQSELKDERHRWAAIGARTQWLEPDEVSRLEPDIPAAESAFLLPDLCQVRNPRHMRALLRACELAGVEVTPDCQVTKWKQQSGRVVAAVTEQGEIAAGRFIVTAGAWSMRLLADFPVKFSTVPVRGQIILLAPGSCSLTHVVERGKQYLVPRRDGRVLIGSTEEYAGFHKANTPEGMEELWKLATTICPKLATATMEMSWSGLRPSAPRGRPYIGRVPGWDHLLVAAGHFRAGLHLSPVTAQILVDLVNDRPIHEDWQSFGL